jgi:hypothetical protein
MFFEDLLELLANDSLMNSLLTLFKLHLLIVDRVCKVTYLKNDSLSSLKEDFRLSHSYHLCLVRLFIVSI